MNTMRRLVRSRWAIPAAAGALIILSFLASGVVGSTLWGDLLMVAAAVVAGFRIVMSALRALRVKVVGIDLLVSVAAIGAIVIANYWEAAAVTFLFAIGHALESATLAKTRSALAELVAVAPDVAVVLREGEQVEVPAFQVTVGETVLVKNGAKVPVDGVVVGGVGAVDEASITGESLPVEKLEGDQVFAGTVATAGFVQVQATGVGPDTTLARIIHRVEEAQDAKARTQAFMDRFSKWYTPGIMLLALALGLITQDVVLALTLLVIGCPGALVISIPVAIVAGIGRGAKDGILIKGGEYLETAAKIDVVAVDKTGTLTEGRPRLTDVIVLDERLDRVAALALAARAEAGSEHPLARPILDAAAAEGVPARGLPEHTEPVPGKGIVAMIDRQRVAVGNLPLMQAEGVEPTRHPALVDAVDAVAAAGRTPMVMAVDAVPAAVFAVADSIRDEAADMVRGLHRAGVERVVMLTGDTQRVAAAVAAHVGIDEVHAGLLPEDKLDAVRELQAAGHTVAMVGDGVNDAPALAASDIGVAMGAAGTGVAIETGDIALMADDLMKLPQAVSLARRTVRVMHQNVAVAMITVAALLAGVIFSGVTMAIGMLVHELSVLAVIANAMRLLRTPRARAAVRATADRREVVVAR
ncbi:heavy metal translocating P-type ATPase [Microbacterium sp.]|uniref:heavy metal translocating P-type ATPase n=1 Tax=Microbacterium sp. TaxID=51671 RepID=UPI003A91D727